MQITAARFQHYTWNSPGATTRVLDIQGIEDFITYSLELAVSYSRVPVRVYRSESLQCLKQ